MIQGTITHTQFTTGMVSCKDCKCKCLFQSKNRKWILKIKLQHFHCSIKNYLNIFKCHCWEMTKRKCNCEDFLIVEIFHVSPFFSHTHTLIQFMARTQFNSMKHKNKIIFSISHFDCFNAHRNIKCVQWINGLPKVSNRKHFRN